MKPAKDQGYELLITYFLFLMVLLCAYSPAIFGHYAYHDDFLYWSKRSDGLHQQHLFLIAIGRILGAWILTISQHFVFHVADINFLRFLSVLFLSLCSVLLFVWVRPHFSKFIDAFLLVCLIFTLPPFESMVSWAIDMYTSIALFAAMLSATYLLRAYDSNGPRRYISTALAFMFLLSSFLIYQPAGMFYWVMGAFLLFLKDKTTNSWMHRILYFSCVGIFTMAFYAVILKVFCLPYEQYLKGIYNPHAWTTHYWGKLIWFIQVPLYNSLNLWNIFPNIVWVQITAVVFSLAILVTMLFENFKKQLFLLFLFLIFFLMSYLPVLLNKEPAPFYRTCMGLVAMLIFAWLWAFQKNLQFFPQAMRSWVLTVILSLATIFGICHCFKNVFLYRMLPSQMEFSYIVNTLASHNLSHYKKIMVIQPVYSSLNRYDEFGTFTTFYENDVGSIVKCAANEIGKILPVLVIGKEIKEADISTLVLDMRQPQRAYEQYIKAGHD